MQGSAKTNDFMLGSATIMLGPQADLFNLGAESSVGLVKNVTLKTTPGFVELTQGVRNQLVYSVMNSNTVGINAEMFEYTPQNIAYSLSLDGSQYESANVETTVSTIYAAPVGPATQGEEDIILTAVTGITVGKYILIKPNAVNDNILIRKVLAVDDTSKTVTMDQGLPVALAVGAKVSLSSVIAVGAQESAPFLACKIVGELADGSAVPMLFPKVRISSGLSMAFKTDNFDNIPFELQIFDLVNSDPHYDYFQGVGPGGTPAKGIILP